ncbi:MAG: hypothetical protein ACRDXX_12725 [Stackebrandtia sp.]
MIDCEATWFCCGNAWGPCGGAGTGACGTCHSGNMNHAWPNASQACWDITRPDTCGVPDLPRFGCGTAQTTTSLCTNAAVSTTIADCGPRTKSFCGEQACCGSTCASNRVMDLTPAAYSQIADVSTGKVPVRVTW